MKKSIITYIITTVVALVMFAGFAGCTSSDDASPASASTQVGENSSTTAEPYTGDDLDRDGIEDAIEDQLIDRFSPIVRFHSDEQYLLAEISWYLQRVRMRLDVNFGLDVQFLDHGEVTVRGLLSQEYQGTLSGLSQEKTDFFLEQTDSNGEDELDTYRLATRNGSDPGSWRCYAHVRPAQIDEPEEYFDIQYIFFYSYNGDMIDLLLESAHEADFEHITVRVEDDLETVSMIYYAAHDTEGKWYQKQSFLDSDDGYSVNDEDRPILYSAIDSHASYPRADTWVRDFLPDDETDENGMEWDSYGFVINVGEKRYPTQGNEWIQYSGRWGEIGEMAYTKGPYSPAYQYWWNGD